MIKKNVFLLLDVLAE